MVIRKCMMVLLLLGGVAIASAQDAKDPSEIQPVKVMAQGINKEILSKPQLPGEQTEREPTIEKQSAIKGELLRTNSGEV